jgi:hypothetical protein
MESSPAPEGETPSQRQARLRREKRQAKIAAGGANRLAAISGASGRKIPEPESTGAPQTGMSMKKPSPTFS